MALLNIEQYTKRLFLSEDAFIISFYGFDQDAFMLPTRLWFSPLLHKKA